MRVVDSLSLNVCQKLLKLVLNETVVNNANM